MRNFLSSKKAKPLLILFYVLCYSVVTAGIFLASEKIANHCLGYTLKLYSTPKVRLNIFRANACTEDNICVSNVIVLQGEIQPDSGKRFSAFLEQESKSKSATTPKDAITLDSTTTICFDSTGGNVAAALEIARLIRKSGFNTCLAHHYDPASIDTKALANGTTFCSSACPLMLLSGKQRKLLGFAFVGIHTFYKLDGRWPLKVEISDEHKIESIKFLESAPDREEGMRHAGLIETAFMIQAEGSKLLTLAEQFCTFRVFTEATSVARPKCTN